MTPVRIFLINLIVLMAVGNAYAATSDKFQLWTTQEQVIDVVAHYPDEPGAHPALVLLPGQSYHKDLRLLKHLALRAVKQGFVVLRFDWSFFYNKEKSPSRNLAREEADLAAVMKFVRESPRIRQDRVYLAGKSLGSILASKSFQEQKSLRGLVLLTPVMKSAEHGNRFYGGVLEDSRPRLVVHGAQDSFSGMKTVKEFFMDSESLDVLTLPGNHSLNLGTKGGKAGAEFSRANIDLAVEHILHWLRFDAYFK